jgi:hypothetical protein
MNAKSLSTSVALAAAALFLGACHHDQGETKTPGADAAGDAPASGPATAAAGGAKIKCFGANACSGQAACDVPDGRVAPGSKGHACAGQNECAKKGWILLTQADCTEQGGEPL